MSTTHPVRKVVDIDQSIADMRARLAVVEGDTDFVRDLPAETLLVLEDHGRALDTLEAAVAEVRRILAQAEPASNDVPAMGGAEWALKCVRAEIRSTLRGE